MDPLYCSIILVDEQASMNDDHHILSVRSSVIQTGDRYSLKLTLVVDMEKTRNLSYLLLDIKYCYCPYLKVLLH